MYRMCKKFKFWLAKHKFHGDWTSMYYGSWLFASSSLQDAMPTISKANYSPWSLHLTPHITSALAITDGLLSPNASVVKLLFFSNYGRILKRFWNVWDHCYGWVPQQGHSHHPGLSWLQSDQKNNLGGPGHRAILGTFKNLSGRSPYRVKSLVMQLYLCHCIEEEL